jgi:hypothetical protein
VKKVFDSQIPLSAFLGTLLLSGAAAAVPPPSTPYVPAAACPANYVPADAEKKCVRLSDAERVAVAGAKRGSTNAQIGVGIPSIAPNLDASKSEASTDSSRK